MGREGGAAPAGAHCGQRGGSVPLGAPGRRQRTVLRVLSPEVRAGALVQQPRPQVLRAAGDWSSLWLRPALEEGSRKDGAHLSAARDPPAPGWSGLELSDRGWVSVTPS